MAGGGGGGGSLFVALLRPLSGDGGACPAPGPRTARCTPLLLLRAGTAPSAGATGEAAPGARREADDAEAGGGGAPPKPVGELPLANEEPKPAPLDGVRINLKSGEPIDGDGVCAAGAAVGGWLNTRLAVGGDAMRCGTAGGADCCVCKSSLFTLSAAEIGTGGGISFAISDGGSGADADAAWNCCCCCICSCSASR